MMEDPWRFLRIFVGARHHKKKAGGREDRKTARIESQRQ